MMNKKDDARKILKAHSEKLDIFFLRHVEINARDQINYRNRRQ